MKSVAMFLMLVFFAVSLAIAASVASNPTTDVSQSCVCSSCCTDGGCCCETGICSCAQCTCECCTSDSNACEATCCGGKESSSAASTLTQGVESGTCPMCPSEKGLKKVVSGAK